MKAISEKALHNLVRLLKTEDPSWRFGSELAFWRSCFEVIELMSGSAAKLRKIADESKRDQLLDTLAEVKYAVIFSELGFKVEIEPLRGEAEGANPDLRISKDDYSCLVEITRFQSSQSPVERLSCTTDMLSEYGDPPRDWQRLFNKIESKFRQAGRDGIIALWNDNDNLEYVEVEGASRYHAKQSMPSRSSLLLFRSHLTDENFFCYKLRDRLPTYQKAWMNELKRVNPKQILFRLYLRSHKPR